MGTSTLLDILGSTIIGGMLLLILLRMNDASVQNTYTNNSELIVQQDLTAVVKLIEYDFRKIGYCANYNNPLTADPTKVILLADSNKIQFLTDVADPPTYPYGDGTVDKLEYYIDTANVPSTPNPNDHLLYRVLNNDTPRGSNLGITMFQLHYYNTLGSELPTPVVNLGAIHTIEIDLQVEDMYGFNNKETNTIQYPTIFWRQIRLVARNLSKR